MEIKKYSPVVIPTLNRYEHFKRCLESLERCTGAANTDVYVGLDYPPLEKYVDGWQKIDSYLRKKEIDNSFHKLYVRRRDHNCGTCKNDSNGSLLLQEVRLVSDTVIITEDDNEFSPCFLQYMNKALIRFYDDNRVHLVCGYNFKMKFPEMYKNNFYISKKGCAWGIGMWYYKEDKIAPYYDSLYLRNIVRDKNTYNVITKRNPDVLYSILSQLKRNRLFGDSIMELYSTINDTYCIIPRVSMVRNWGEDGSGEHSPNIDEKRNNYYISQEIMTDTDFDFSDDIFTMEPQYLEREKLYRHPLSMTSIKKLIKQGIFKFDLFLLRKFNIIIKSKYI